MADHIALKGLLADFGEQIHIVKVNECYVVMIEADSLVFEKVFSPIEFLNPDDIGSVFERIGKKVRNTYL